MERFKNTVIITLLVIGLLTPTVWALSPSRQLREALYQEQVSGDIDAAIEIYQKVINSDAEYKRYIAQAHHRLGLCYLKKGDQQKAIPHFETILKDYSAQKKTVAKAKKELKKIKSAASNLSETDLIIARSYVIHYKTVGTTEDGLKVFNKSHPRGVRTHHANRYRKDGQSISSICTDTETEKDQIVSMINNNYELSLVKVEPPKLSQSNNPTVISTTPNVYANDVSPGLRKITVTFDFRMADGSWSWTGGGETFPEINGNIHYDPSLTTCTLPVKLKPGKVYWIGINSPSHKNFKTADRIPAQRHVILFATKDANGQPTPIPQDLLEKAKVINKDVNKKTDNVNWFELLGSEIPSFLGSIYGEICAEAGMKRLYSHSLMYVVDENFVLRGGGMGYVYNYTGKTITEKHRIFGTMIPYMEFYGIMGDEMDVDMVPDENRKNYYDAYWNPKEPLSPGGFYNFATVVTGNLKLPMTASGTGYEWTMDNKFGDHCYETFFLVVPQSIKLISKSEDYTNMKNIGGWDIYWWKKEVQANTGHTVKIVLNGTDKLVAEDLAAEGWKLWGERKLVEAEGKFKEAIAIDGGCENAYQGLGWAQLNQGKRFNAKDSFKKCIAINHKNSAALNGLGWIAHSDGEMDTAIEWWEKAVKAAPFATASLSGLTQVHTQRENYPQAIKYYKMWLKAEPNNQQAKDGLEKAKQQQQKVGAVIKYEEFTDEHIENVVRKAVTVISTCAEGDPKIADALKSLKAIKPDLALEKLKGHLGSDMPTKRRSAIYIVWRGGFDDISIVIPKLIKLCSHEAFLTRGMTALALGEHEIATSYDVLTDMTLNDNEGYARRCGAYALGLLGDKKALTTLKRATEDSDPMVKQNAEAAITMLTELKDE